MITLQDLKKLAREEEGFFIVADADLTGLDFSEIGLIQNFAFFDCNFNGSSLSNTRFNNVVFNGGWAEDCELENAVFENCELKCINLDRSNMKGSQVSSSYLYEIEIHGADLSNASFNGNDIDSSRFFDCKLTAVDFHDSKLSRTYFFDSNLVATNFEHITTDGDIEILGSDTENVVLPKAGGVYIYKEDIFVNED